MVDWTRAFATAYERNRFIATEARDAETNLTAASVYLSVTSVTRLPTGWALELGGKRSTAYASGAHGDHPLAVGYFLNETTVRREELDDRADDVGPTEGGVVLDCRA